ncbi:MAG: hypothetical protein IPJ20_01465 [Flammeovirgaceae bacterium]|nr:hypothetical protein [Flammeovirgaceae bacterium]
MTISALIIYQNTSAEFPLSLSVQKYFVFERLATNPEASSSFLETVPTSFPSENKLLDGFSCTAQT